MDNETRDDVEHEEASRDEIERRDLADREEGHGPVLAGSQVVRPNETPNLYRPGDTIHVAHPDNPDAPPARFVIPHPSQLTMGTPHDFGSSMVNPPDSAFNDPEGIKAHVRRHLAHLKDYASRVGHDIGGNEGDFLRALRERF